MRLPIIAFTSIALAGTAPLAAQAPAAQPAAAAPIKYGTFGIDLDARDTSVKPGDDFHAHASGTWLRNTEIPADRTSWSVWSALGVNIEQQLKAIVDDLAARGTANDLTGQRVGAFYAAWMDEAGIERRGTAPLRPYLQQIEGATSRGDLLKLFAKPGFPSPVAIVSLPNPIDPTRYIVAISQSGLGMPNRDHYLKDGAEYDRYRAAYRDYVVQVHKLAGIPNAEAKADAIIALERRIAEAQWTAERNRNVLELYNPMNRAQLTELAPQFDWTSFLEQSGYGDFETLIAAQPSAFKAIGEMLETVPLQTWKDWTAFQFIDNHAAYLPKAFDQANFNFYGRTLNGQQEQRERWKRGISLLNGSMGEALGKIYVERHYPAESQRQMTDLIGNLRGAFAERLQRLEWMDEETRAEALKKLEAFEPRIGHPANWIDYSGMEVDRGDLLGNMVRAAEFQHKLQLSRLPKPVDRSLWAMNAHTINASYNPLLNQITFPAGILQPPFFDPTADPAVNYGAIGAVIGHEIGHGFDDQGRRFDGSGRLRDWWSDSSAKRFEERAARLGAQYGTYQPLPGLNVNPKLTMGENIGDLGGVEMAYAAYRRHVAQHGEPPVINGLTGDQRFFLAWAQVWRSKEREDLIRQGILTDPHSPDQFRVNGVVRNIDAWYRAFDVQPGDKLYLPPEQRVSIW